MKNISFLKSKLLSCLVILAISIVALVVFFVFACFNKIYYSNTSQAVLCLSQISGFVFFLENNAVILIFAMVLLLILFIIAFITLLTLKSRNNHVLHSLAFNDELTKLPNFLHFKKQAQKLLATAKPNQYVLVSVDIDNFKYINSIYGFKVGDKVINVLAHNFYKIAEAENILMARFIADDFIFMLEYSEALANMNYMIVPKSKKYLHQLEEVLGNSFKINFSIGSYLISDPNKDIHLMVDNARIAKKTVKNIYETAHAQFDEELEKTVAFQRDITTSMTQALKDNEFVPFLQPKIDLVSKKIIGAEVLVRWFSKTKGIIYPNDFISIFEKCGFISQLDYYMFEKACLIIHKWTNDSIIDIPMLSVNLSKITFSDKNLAFKLKQIADKYAIPLNLIEVELTESAICEDFNLIIENIKKLKELGLIVSMDDFGSGYSSLNRLKDIPVDIIKLDRHFLNDTLGSSKGSDIIHSVINMAKNLKIITVAEGVETFKQLTSLKSMGCDIAQGFYFSKPIPIEKFETQYNIY